MVWKNEIGIPAAFWAARWERWALNSPNTVAVEMWRASFYKWRHSTQTCGVKCKDGNADNRLRECGRVRHLIVRAECCCWELCGLTACGSLLVRMWYLVLVFLGGSGEFKSLELGACITISRGRAVVLSNALWEALRGAAAVCYWVTEWVQK